MERQQHMHMKEVYVDSASKSLTSNLGNENFLKSSFKSAYTQDTQTQRTNEMQARASKAKSDTAYFEMSSRDDMEPPLELDTASSSDELVDVSNCIHVEDHMASIRNLQNDHRLRNTIRK